MYNCKSVFAYCPCEALVHSFHQEGLLVQLSASLFEIPHPCYLQVHMHGTVKIR